MHHQTSSQRRLVHASGFTLVELLVVIAIVALLIAILLPSISKAKEAAYTSLCLENMHQVAISTVCYAADHFDSVAPNCSRIDGVDATFGPYQQLTNTVSRTYLAMTSHYQGLMRMDNSMTAPSMVQDYMWTSGLGVMWSGGHIPWTLAGARSFWCPGERRANFKGTSPNSTMSGPGRYWNSGLGANPNTFVPGTNGGAWTVQGSYVYRSLGLHISPAVSFYQGPSKGSWRLSSMSRYTELVDCALNIYGDSVANAGIKPMYTHGGTAYFGMNKLGYDGHAKWMLDLNASWQLYNAPYGGLLHDTGYGNASNFQQWAMYDLAG